MPCIESPSPPRARAARTGPSRRAAILLTLTAVLAPACLARAQEAEAPTSRLLYVAVPGIRDYLEYGGHGLLVFDIDNGHRFVRRIPTAGKDPSGKPLNVKGICAHAGTRRLYISTTQTITALELPEGRILWEKPYDGGCDRMALSPDGAIMYVPSFEKEHWHVVRASDGTPVARIEPRSGAHNTVYALDGREVYLAGLRSPLLTVADPSRHVAARTVGPFGAAIRPFTVNGTRTRCYVNVNELLGFEVGDLTTGKKLHRVEVSGYSRGPVKRHGCPSHGIGLTPDERELWVVDAYNQAVHIFDATADPPVQRETIRLRDEPGWITFSLDGRFAYPSTGEVIDTSSRRIVARLVDEHGVDVQSEKMVEVQYQGGRPVRAGDQFGLGRVREPAPPRPPVGASEAPGS